MTKDEVTVGTGLICQKYGTLFIVSSEWIMYDFTTYCKVTCPEDGPEEYVYSMHETHLRDYKIATEEEILRVRLSL